MSWDLNKGSIPYIIIIIILLFVTQKMARLLILNKNIFKPSPKLINKELRALFSVAFKFKPVLKLWWPLASCHSNHRVFIFSTRYLAARLMICAKYEQNRSWYHVTAFLVAFLVVNKKTVYSLPCSK